MDAGYRTIPGSKLNVFPLYSVSEKPCSIHGPGDIEGLQGDLDVVGRIQTLVAEDADPAPFDKAGGK